MDSSTQTEIPSRDIHFMNRALKAERALLIMRMDRYKEILERERLLREKDTLSKMNLYRYKPEKVQELQNTFQNITEEIDNRTRRAEMIFAFNIKALQLGKPLEELPPIDAPIDVHQLKLAPPTYPLSESDISFLSNINRLPYFAQTSGIPVPQSAIFQNNQNLIKENGVQAFEHIGRPPNGWPPNSSKVFLPKTFDSYVTYGSATNMSGHSGDNDSGEEILRMINNASINNFDKQTTQPFNQTSQNRPFISPSQQFVNPASTLNGKQTDCFAAEYNKANAADVLASLQLGLSLGTNLNSSPDVQSAATLMPQNTSATSSSTVKAQRHSDQAQKNASPPLSGQQKEKQVIPVQTLNQQQQSKQRSAPATKKKQYRKDAVNLHPNFDILSTEDSSMGLDSISANGSVEKSATATSIKKANNDWSFIGFCLADDTVPCDDNWRKVNTHKARSTNQKTPMMPATAISEVGNPNQFGFEQMVKELQDKHNMTRPDVIAVLQIVREDRGGDVNISLQTMAEAAENIICSKPLILVSSGAKAKPVEDHPEPCDNQLCSARLKLLKYRTELCLSYQTTGSCHMRPGMCVYAHGERELRQLPKEELCERYLEGLCQNKKCVYAHGNQELRRKQPTISIVDYLKTQNAQQKATSHYINKESLELTAVDLDPNGEECSICMEPMSRKSRMKLDCGHDTFHYKCLKKWVAGVGDRSCPLCRSTTLLPEEYPHLGK